MSVVSGVSAFSACSDHTNLSSSLLNSDALQPPQPKKRIGKQLVKTELCKHFARGFCRYQEKCSYAHLAAELLSKPNLEKTKICVSFLSGACSNPNCSYAHGIQEMRQVSFTAGGSEVGGRQQSDISTEWHHPQDRGSRQISQVSSNISGRSSRSGSYMSGRSAVSPPASSLGFKPNQGVVGALGYVAEDREFQDNNQMLRRALNVNIISGGNVSLHDLWANEDECRAMAKTVKKEQPQSKSKVDEQVLAVAQQLQDRLQLQRRLQELQHDLQQQLSSHRNGTALAGQMLNNQNHLINDLCMEFAGLLVNQDTGLTAEPLGATQQPTKVDLTWRRLAEGMLKAKHEKTWTEARFIIQCRAAGDRLSFMESQMAAAILLRHRDFAMMCPKLMQTCSNTLASRLSADVGFGPTQTSRHAGFAVAGPLWATSIPGRIGGVNGVDGGNHVQAGQNCAFGMNPSDRDMNRRNYNAHGAGSGMSGTMVGGQWQETAVMKL